MEVIFKSEDPMEIRRLAKATDMACFIFELVHNAWRGEEDESKISMDKVREMLEDNNIIIDDIID